LEPKAINDALDGLERFGGEARMVILPDKSG